MKQSESVVGLLFVGLKKVQGFLVSILVCQCITVQGVQPGWKTQEQGSVACVPLRARSDSLLGAMVHGDVIWASTF